MIPTQGLRLNSWIKSLKKLRIDQSSANMKNLLLIVCSPLARLNKKYKNGSNVGVGLLWLILLLIPLVNANFMVVAWMGQKLKTPVLFWH